MPKIIEGKIVAKGMRFGIVASRFNDFISGRLIEGAVDALTRAGAEEKEIQIVRVPGAFELPLAAKKMAKSGRFDAVICLGAVIRGATPHFEYISAEVSKGIAMRGAGNRGAGGLRRPDDGHHRTGDRTGGRPKRGTRDGTPPCPPSRWLIFSKNCNIAAGSVIGIPAYRMTDPESEGCMHQRRKAREVTLAGSL